MSQPAQAPPPVTSGRLTRVDLLLLLLASTALFLLCILRSRQRLLWNDEVLGYVLLSDPSLAHAVRGWWEGADGGGFFYYLSGHLWMLALRPSALSLRLFSTFGFIASLILVWAAARRHYTVVPVTFGAALVYFTAPAMLWQEVNGRFYGMLVFAAAWAAFCFLRTVNAAHPTRSLLIATTAAHAILIGSHIFGILFSLGMLLGTLGVDLLLHRVRWKLYLAIVLGWLMLPISWHAIASSTSIAQNNVFWTKRPTPFDLVFGAFLFDKSILAAMLLLLLWVLVRRLVRSTTSASTSHWKISPSLPVWALVFSFVLAQIFLFTKSQFGLSGYADRYLLPLAIPLVFVLADLLTRASGPWLRGLASPRVTGAAALFIFIPCMVHAVRKQPYAGVYPSPGFVARVVSRLPPDRTVVVTLVPLFLVLRTYDPAHHYILLDDRAYDLAHAGPGSNLSGQRLMENWKRAGFAGDSILDCTEILDRNPHFTLLLDPGRLSWLRDRLLSQPVVDASQVSSFTEWSPSTVWHVRRSVSASPCS